MELRLSVCISVVCIYIDTCTQDCWQARSLLASVYMRALGRVKQGTFNTLVKRYLWVWKIWSNQML